MGVLPGTLNTHKQNPFPDVSGERKALRLLESCVSATSLGEGLDTTMSCPVRIGYLRVE